MPDLADEDRTLFDGLIRARDPDSLEPGTYISLSPMTHPAHKTLRRVGEGLRAAALIYDFIPLDHPGYLSSAMVLKQYRQALEHLRLYGQFFAISRFTARRLAEIAEIEPA